MTHFVVAGAGPRRLKIAPLAIRTHVEDEIRAAILVRQLQHGERLVIMSGMAEGYDELLARCALNMKAKLWAAIPNRDYGRYYWSERHSVTHINRIGEYLRIRNAAWKITHVMEDIHHTHMAFKDDRPAPLWRNEYMAEQCDDSLVWQPTSKGTSHFVKQMRQAGKWNNNMVLAAV